MTSSGSETGDSPAAAGEAPTDLDTGVATTARIYDYWLGGTNNFAAGRVTAEKVPELWPEAPIVARENRAFLGRAVRLLAGAGISQFLDLGAGLPATGSVHQTAQAVAPDSRVVYVDSDPMVLAHARARTRTSASANTSAADADIS